MSQTLVRQSNSIRQQELSAIEQEKIVGQQGGYILSDAHWFNPEDECIYRGEYSALNPNWDKSNIVWSKKKAEAARDRAKNGYNDIVGIKTAGYSEEIYPQVVELLDLQREFKRGNKNAFNENLMQGGILRRTDYLNLKTLQAENRIIMGKPPAHVLLGAVDNVATSELEFKFYKGVSTFDMIQKKISEQEIPRTGNLLFETDTAKLDLYGAHIGTTFEFRMTTYDIDVFAQHTAVYAGQLDRAKNEAVADVINAPTGSAGASWTAVTGSPSQNTNNPYTDVDSALAAIEATNKYTPNVIFAPKAVYRAYNASTPWIQGNTVGVQSPVVNALPYQSAVNFVAGAVRLFEGIPWVVDSLITAGTFVAADRSTLRYWTGPERAITYSHATTEEEGVIYKAYFAAKNLDTAGQAKRTGLV